MEKNDKIQIEGLPMSQGQIEMQETLIKSKKEGYMEKDKKICDVLTYSEVKGIIQIHELHSDSEVVYAIECLEKEAKKSIELAKYYGKIAKKLKEV